MSNFNGLNINTSIDCFDAATILMANIPTQLEKINLASNRMLNDSKIFVVVGVVSAVALAIFLHILASAAALPIIGYGIYKWVEGVRLKDCFTAEKQLADQIQICHQSIDQLFRLEATIIEAESKIFEHQESIEENLFLISSNIEAIENRFSKSLQPNPKGLGDLKFAMTGCQTSFCQLFPSSNSGSIDLHTVLKDFFGYVATMLRSTTTLFESHNAAIQAQVQQAEQQLKKFSPSAFFSSK